MSDVGRRIAENLATVRERIAQAARHSGRMPEAVTLVAVTKYVAAELAAKLIEAGCADLGESRPQDLWHKAAVLDPPSAPHPSPGSLREPPSPARGEGGVVRWHLIGHLQRNKIRRTLPLVHLLHSVDSQRLLAALDDEAALQGRVVPVLVEVNISGDASKTGLPPDQLEPLLQLAQRWPNVSIRGLMGMASLEGGPATAQRDFGRLRELRDRAASNLPPSVSLAELSMGMSEDFETAIAEGATMVRVGSALFEGTGQGAMITLEDHPDGVILPVRAQAGARQNAVGGERAGRLQVSVTQAPERGKANKAIIAVLAKALALKKSQIELVWGETSPQKRFLIRGIQKAELAASINALTARP